MHLQAISPKLNHISGNIVEKIELKIRKRRDSLKCQWFSSDMCSLNAIILIKFTLVLTLFGYMLQLPVVLL